MRYGDRLDEDTDGYHPFPSHHTHQPLPDQFRMPMNASFQPVNGYMMSHPHPQHQQTFLPNALLERREVVRTPPQNAMTPCDYSPSGWSSHTDSSGFSSPPSDEREWNLLSDMLIEDALETTAVNFLPSSASVSTNENEYQVQERQHQLQRPIHKVMNPLQQHYMGVIPSGPESTALKKDLSSQNMVNSTPSIAAVDNYSLSASEVQNIVVHDSVSPAGHAVNVPKTAPKKSRAGAAKRTTAIKTEPLSKEELKKQRRRDQIASSVQRHREKKKNLVSALKHDLSSLTAHLEFLRSQRKSLHPNENMVEWEEAAITQRRKRKQSEELNQRMKKALFQQSAFLFGMRAMMDGLPGPQELDIQDWIHSYTVLSARDVASRRKEYMSVFSESKMDLAAKIVARETDLITSRLTMANPYYANVQLLHDGTRGFGDERDFLFKKELHEQTLDPGDGKVMKKFTSIFLFQEREKYNFDMIHRIAFETTKQLGVFWPAVQYSSRVHDVVEVNPNSRIYFTDLRASMDVIDDHQSDDKIDVECRMLCCEQKSDNESLVVWDFADKDDLYPFPQADVLKNERIIRRNSVGAVVIRREPGGLVSIRSISVKTFAPLETCLPLDPQSEEAMAVIHRRLGLQVTESERMEQKCIRYVYDALQDAFQEAMGSEKPT